MWRRLRRKSGLDKNGVMSSTEALPRLKQLITEAGPDPASFSPRQGLEIFDRFMRLPVDCSDDAVLVEIGVTLFGPDDRDDGPWFCVGLVRQFSFEIDGEYDHMDQLLCNFQRPVDDAPTDISLIAWTYDHPSLDQYFAHVRATPEWQQSVELSNWWTWLYH